MRLTQTETPTFCGEEEELREVQAHVNVSSRHDDDLQAKLVNRSVFEQWQRVSLMETMWWNFICEPSKRLVVHSAAPSLCYPIQARSKAPCIMRSQRIGACSNTAHMPSALDSRPLLSTLTCRSQTYPPRSRP